MRISQMLSGRRPVFSFEFFPPKDEAAAAGLFDVILHLKALRPNFVSVTYGAGGSTRTKTLDLVARIKKDIGMEAMAHLTCIGHSREEIRSILRELAERGIENVLALRGDPPRGQAEFKPHPQGFQYASELAEEVVRSGDFCFGVAGYPEKHIEAPSFEEDLRHLKEKVELGASFVITQLFFRNDAYFSFVDKARAIGVRCPIIPGIMPVTNFAQIQRFATLCGATLPPELVRKLEPVQSNPEAVTRLGVDYATRQCRELLQNGAPGIHFYTLNKSRATREILQQLDGLRRAASPLLRDV